jgi:T5SS/PEP-CTERM-associated repeat protein
VCLALFASPSSRGDEQCNQIINSSWTNPGTGDWFVSSNWCGGVPICLGFACISNGGTAQIGPGTQANACETFLGHDYCCRNSGQSGSLSVNGGTLRTCNELHVGYGGTGKLTITNGGQVNTTFAGDIGAVAGSNGSATVDGTNSQWTIMGGGVLYVAGTINGEGGTGLLTATNSATVTAGSVHVYKSGTLTGNGTVSVNSGSGTVTVDGTLAPSGTLTISGNLTFANLAANMRCNVSSTSVDNAQVSGRALLNGKLSVTVNVTGDFTLLHAGQGRNGTKFSSYSFTYTGCLSASVSYQDNPDGSSDVILHVVSTCN